MYRVFQSREIDERIGVRDRLFHRSLIVTLRTADWLYETFLVPGEDVVSTKTPRLFDGASIPRLLWPVIGSPFSGWYVTGAKIHDAGYGGFLYYGRHREPRPHRLTLLVDAPRRWVDAAFDRVNTCTEVRPWRRAAIAAGLAVGGAPAWKRNRPCRDALQRQLPWNLTMTPALIEWMGPRLEAA